MKYDHRFWRKTVQSVPLLLAACILMIGVSGCMDRNSTVDKMVAYMNDKYDDHFEYAAPFGGRPGATSKQIIVSSEQYPEAQVWVEYYEQDGKEVFADNYIDYKYEEQTRALLQELMENTFDGKATVLYSVPSKGGTNSFSDRTTFEEYISNTRIGFRAIVLLPSGIDCMPLENRLKEAVKHCELTAFGTVYFTDDGQEFEKAFDRPQRDMDLLYRLQFSMDEPGAFSSLVWGPGNEE